MPIKKKKVSRKTKAARRPVRRVAKKSVKRSKKVKRKVYLTFPKEQTKQAVICDMYDRHHVKFNIRSASVDDQMGLIAMEMEADSYDQMVKAFKYFEKRGVKVEPIEISVIEP
jgi:ABC-type methionine transport system ATPase subunit